MTQRRIYTPREYGPLVTNHIIDVPRCAIWAGMGLGKSVMTLTAIDTLQLVDDSPTLVVAPLRVARDGWKEEAAKWQHLSHMRVVPIIGDIHERRMALQADAQVFTINYENLPWLVEHLGDRWPFAHVVADESTKLKSYRGSIQRSSKGNEFVRGGGGMRARALGQIAHKKVKRFTQLTGTPAPNGLIDLWGQMWFIDGGQRLGRTFEAFKKRWFQQSYDGYGSIPLPHAQDEIQERLRDVCLTIDAKDYFDLAEPIVNNIFVDLPLKARKLYKDMEDEMYAQIEGHEIEAFNAAARTQKLLQMANGAVYLNPEVQDDSHPKAREWKETHDVKLQALDEIVEEAGGNPVLVAYQFKSDLERLKRAFPKGRVLANADEMRDFKTGRYPLGFGHPASMGHGVDGLQYHCHTAAFFGHWWNLEERLQFIERIGPVRQHQANTGKVVTIHNILARDTVDEDILERNETKAEVQEILKRGMKRRRSK